MTSIPADEAMIGAHTSLNSFHVSYGEPQNRQLVRLASQRAARRNHIAQFVHVSRHLGSTSSFNLAVTLPVLYTLLLRYVESDIDDVIMANLLGV